MRKLEEAKEELNQFKQGSKPEKSKEELYRLRKEMMKRPKFNERAESQPQQIDMRDSELEKPRTQKMVSFHDPAKQISEPNPELMDRLAQGKKAQVLEAFELAVSSCAYTHRANRLLLTSHTASTAPPQRTQLSELRGARSLKEKLASDNL